MEDYKLSASEAETARRALLASLKDPYSAKLGQAGKASKLADGRVLVCIPVNAKNSFGGYNGAAPGFIWMRNGQAERVDIDHDLPPCGEIKQ
jgi:hypothetical protein